MHVTNAGGHTTVAHTATGGSSGYGAPGRLTAVLRSRASGESLQATKHLASFVSTRDGKAEIFVQKVGGSVRGSITKNTTRDVQPVYSPDGGRIAFTPTRDKNREVYAMNAYGSNERNLTKNAKAQDYAPAWSEDGKLITTPPRGRATTRIYREPGRRHAADYRAVWVSHHDGASTMDWDALFRAASWAQTGIGRGRQSTQPSLGHPRLVKSLRSTIRGHPAAVNLACAILAPYPSPRLTPWPPFLS